MIRLTLLRHGGDTIGTTIKHQSSPPGRVLAFTEVRSPLVFWNITYRCNLSCHQCYINAGRSGEEELSTDEALRFMDDIASIKVPLLMFTGGEPLLRPDFWVLADHARQLGIKTAISSNGTLIKEKEALDLKKNGVEYVGVSLDGATELTNDGIRGQGSFTKAVDGLTACVNAGLNCGVRVTVSKDNFDEIPDLIDLTMKLKVPRFCLYWLVPSGRGKGAYQEKQLDEDQISSIFDMLFKASKDIDPKIMEILTVDAPQDGAYLLRDLSKDGDPETMNALKLLQCTGDSCSAGNRVVNVDPHGNIYPCQFLQVEEQKIGNLRERRFSEIWKDPSNSVLQGFRNKKAMLQGECAKCSSKDICAGGCRARALYAHDNIWASDPFCILSKLP